MDIQDKASLTRRNSHGWNVSQTMGGGDTENSQGNLNI